MNMEPARQHGRNGNCEEKPRKDFGNARHITAKEQAAVSHDTALSAFDRS
jgi:hypothetical protein